MTVSASNPKPLTIAHATDLDPEGGIAFRHSVALARDTGAVLYSMHANPASSDSSREILDANQMLREWNWHVGEGVQEPAIEFYKMLHSCCEDPVDTLLDAMREVEPDLLIVGKHPRAGFELLRDSVAESVALNTEIPTLFLPIGGRGFVDQDNGVLTLDRILIPVQDEETMLQAFESVRTLLERLGRCEAEIILLHVGDDEVLDDLVVPETEGGPSWRRLQRSGDLAEAIVDTVEEEGVDLIVMGTRGHDSLADMFRGSRTEQLIRRAPCPVLSVPLVGRTELTEPS
jgi:nucleotide-binding universal stress UspA family protein